MLIWDRFQCISVMVQICTSLALYAFHQKKQASIFCYITTNIAECMIFLSQKMLAKMVSSVNKPNKQTSILSSAVSAFLKPLHVRKASWVSFIQSFNKQYISMQ
jgi:hypothetical protein